MNKFTTLSTKDYAPLSYRKEYFHNKYELIKSFISKRFGEDFSEILAMPIINSGVVEWYTKKDKKLKRVSEFPKPAQEKILNLYWQKINKINDLSNSFSSSNSYDKKRWAELINNVFNSNNNIVYSDGDEIVILWGWKFNTKQENYVPLPVINASANVAEKIKKPIQSKIIEEGSEKPEQKPIDPTPKKQNEPWYIQLWEWLKNMFERFWWIFLLIILIWFILNLDSCIPQNIKDPSSKTTKNIIYKNNPKDQPNNWNPDNNNTGVKEDEFKQIVEHNLPNEIYENLLIDENGNQRILPNKPKVNVPINMEYIIENDYQQMIVPDRINLYLKNSKDKIEDFAIKFKEEYPSDEYQIIYRDNKMRRIQIRVPEQEREKIKKEIKNNLNNNALIWDETIFERSNFNDPQLSNNNINYYFKSINIFDAWKKTTGNKDIIIAVIDDGFDLNHNEINKNIVKPYNVAYKNNKVYANNDLSHGTHVAGLAISMKNNNFGACGVAPDCSFMPIQIGNDIHPGMFAMTDIIDGVLYAINNDANVINLSIQSLFPEEAKQITNEQIDMMIGNDEQLFWNELFKIANDSNISIVISAGNLDLLIGLDAMKRDSSIITVSATDNYNNKATFSNYGKRSTISAPGVNIYSCKPGGEFTEMSGTSMSAPIISGVVALMKSIQPDLTNKEIISILQKSGKYIDESIGPLVQVDRALTMCNINHKNINKLNTDSIKNEIRKLENKIIELKNLID